MQFHFYSDSNCTEYYKRITCQYRRGTYIKDRLFRVSVWILLAMALNAFSCFSLSLMYIILSCYNASLEFIFAKNFSQSIRNRRRSRSWDDSSRGVKRERESWEKSSSITEAAWKINFHAAKMVLLGAMAAHKREFIFFLRQIVRRMLVSKPKPVGKVMIIDSKWTAKHLNVDLPW